MAWPLCFTYAGNVWRSDMPLEKELAVFEQKLPEFRDQEGRFVLIHGDAVVDFFSTYDDALKEGYQKFGLESFSRQPTVLG